MFKNFLSYYRPHSKLFILDIFTAICIASFTILIPRFTFIILDNYLPHSDLKSTLGYLGIIGIILVLLTTANFFNVKWGHILGVRMEADMRRDLFAHIQHLSFSYFDRTKTGHLMSRISNDLSLIAEMAHHSPEDFIISVLIIGGSFIFMFVQNPLFALLTFIPLPFIIFWGTIFMRRMKHSYRDVRKTVADLNSEVENSIQGIREVKAFTNEKLQYERFHLINSRFKGARERVFGTLASFHSGIIAMTQSYSVLFVGIGAVLIYYKRATFPEVFTFFMYSRYTVMPIIKMLNFVEQFQQGYTAFERFYEVMQEDPEIKDKPRALPLENISGEVELRNVSFRYQVDPNSTNASDSELVLDSVNLRVPPGKTVALVGESGAGKSTIAALIPRFYEVNTGEVLIDGHNVMDLTQASLRENIGIVRQRPFLFDTTIRENILLGAPNASEEEIIEAAKQANIYDFITSLPAVFETQVGEQGVKLSGGQLQRLALARVFLKDPKILIFDEATSALDNEAELLVQESMQRLCHNRTTLIIAHRLSTVRHADFIYCLKSGKVVEYGTHSKLLSQGGYYAKLYNMHSF